MLMQGTNVALIQLALFIFASSNLSRNLQVSGKTASTSPPAGFAKNAAFLPIHSSALVISMLTEQASRISEVQFDIKWKASLASSEPLHCLVPFSVNKPSSSATLSNRPSLVFATLSSIVLTILLVFWA